MLTELDESLLHQCAETFAHAAVSDHRFFDRTVIGMQSPDGEVALINSFGVYKNNNVMDGFAMVQSGRQRQYNQRYSRSFAADPGSLTLGPMSLEVLQPLQSVRIRHACVDAPISYDLTWQAALPPHVEQRHFLRLGGRVVRDHIRFDQFGVANGWLQIEGGRIAVERWFTWRDHSWGVRPGVGGYEPFTGVRQEDGGHLGIYLWWLTEHEGGLFQLQEKGNGERIYLDGHVAFRDGRPPVSVISATHNYHIQPGTRLFSRGELELRTSDGQDWHIDVESMGRAWVYKGSGYDHGFNDERGLGVWRGDWLAETDVYDISHVENVGLPDGRVIKPVHREQFAAVTVNGRPGFAHSPFVSTGVVNRYHLEGPAEGLPG